MAAAPRRQPGSAGVSVPQSCAVGSEAQPGVGDRNATPRMLGPGRGCSLCPVLGHWEGWGQLPATVKPLHPLSGSWRFAVFSFLGCLVLCVVWLFLAHDAVIPSVISVPEPARGPSAVSSSRTSQGFSSPSPGHCQPHSSCLKDEFFESWLQTVTKWHLGLNHSYLSK